MKVGIRFGFLFVWAFNVFADQQIDFVPKIEKDSLGLVSCSFSDLTTVPNWNRDWFGGSLSANQTTLWRLSVERKDHTREGVLYPVFESRPVIESSPSKDNKLSLRCWFRTPVGFSFAPDGSDSLIVEDVSSGYPQRITLVKSDSIKMPDDRSTIEKHYQEWREGFRKALLADFDANDEHEMELLLYLREFGQIPETSVPAWKQSPLFRYLGSVTGYNDLRDAIPTNDKHEIILTPETRLSPEPIVLPQVASEAASSLPENHPSRWVPRSTYYAEFPGLASMTTSLRSLAGFWDSWTRSEGAEGAGPKTADALISETLARLGLSPETLQSLESQVEKVVLAGWDPYFQSGTSLLLILQTKQPLAELPSAPFKQQEGNCVLLCTGERLFQMALKSHPEGKSLLQESGFDHSRTKLKTDEKEKIFLYLSDFWLTNFLSPRWKIGNDRLIELDARLRLVSLLRLALQKEQGGKLEDWDLEKIKKSANLPQAVAEWLFDGLELQGKEIRHRQLGGLFSHPAVDALPFEKVSDREFQNYETFKNEYVSRWRQMDPVAIQGIQKEKNLWRWKLLQSPLSRRSDFALLQGWSNPIPHTFEKVEGLALGLSVSIATPMLRTFGLQGEFPVNIFAQAVCGDFAPPSYGPGYWLEDEWSPGPLSFASLPAALILPRLVLNFASPFLGQIQPVASRFEGVQSIPGPWDSDYFSLFMVEKADHGNAYFGVNPNFLKNVRDHAGGEFKTDETPCQLRTFADFQEGYLLRRRFLYELVKNRTVESWKRTNRLFRISRMLGMSEEFSFSTPEWAKALPFPIQKIMPESLLNAMPVTKDLSPRRHSWGSLDSGVMRNLPSVFRDLGRLDNFVTLAENEILFQSDFLFDENIPPARRQTATANAAPGPTTTLDF